MPTAGFPSLLKRPPDRVNDVGYCAEESPDATLEHHGTYRLRPQFTPQRGPFTPQQMSHEDKEGASKPSLSNRSGSKTKDLVTRLR